MTASNNNNNTDATTVLTISLTAISTEPITVPLSTLIILSLIIQLPTVTTPLTATTALKTSTENDFKMWFR